ncbi:hypothetical protein BU14_0192s0031 [Porphyra umbilicalis]|uniref:Prefoldin subunit 5 n=1 Tax=Porphyra umbilicalis TaxID=2786 RepID=A0A1X6P6E6_PORUM|nr:hypothetical protein BU14_0192s0031 [Porphyra umbilicalis]|eukprot:OSX76414.1 hypothetical protein BU14_0192s0031 [Porphyra umbilicalis]
MAAVGGVGGSVPVTQLTVEQLGHVRQTTEREIEMLMTKIGELNVAHQKLTASRECATFMGESSTPQPVLVPLTTSIYVPGVIQNPSELMVDVGTGYFISKNPADAASYFSRRMAMMKEQLDKAYGVLNQKRQLFEAVSHLLQNKLEMAQAAQAQAGAQPSG